MFEIFKNMKNIIYILIFIPSLLFSQETKNMELVGFVDTILEVGSLDQTLVLPVYSESISPEENTVWKINSILFDFSNDGYGSKYYCGPGSCSGGCTMSYEPGVGIKLETINKEINLIHYQSADHKNSFHNINRYPFYVNTNSSLKMFIEDNGDISDGWCVDYNALIKVYISFTKFKLTTP